MKQHRRQPKDSTSEDMIFDQPAISWNFLADEFQEIIGIEPPSDFKQVRRDQHLPAAASARAVSGSAGIKISSS
jgi:hypothetical protein